MQSVAIGEIPDVAPVLVVQIVVHPTNAQWPIAIASAISNLIFPTFLKTFKDAGGWRFAVVASAVTAFLYTFFSGKFFLFLFLVCLPTLNVISYVRTKLTLNDLEVVVYRKKRPSGIERVVILDDYEDVSPLEAELIVRYLYAEGFLKSDEPYLEVVKNRYGVSNSMLI